MRKALKLLLVFGIIATLCVGSYLAFKYFVYGQLYEARPDIAKGSILDKLLKNHEKNIYKPDADASQRPYSVLLLGLDEKEMKQGRSDSMMVAFVDPKYKKAHLLSIPRDTYVQIAGGKKDKITHAHNNGINATIMTVEDFLDTKIDYYAKINFDGFRELVETLGGITVDVEKTMTFNDRITHTMFTLEKGKQKLNGLEALNYARFRSDGEGDFGRNRRQQQVIKAIIDESLDFRNITKVNALLKDLGKNVKTDMNFDVLAKTLTKMKKTSSEDIISIPLDAYPTSINGISYVEVKDESLQDVKQYIKDILDEKDPAPLKKNSNE